MTSRWESASPEGMAMAVKRTKAKVGLGRPTAAEAEKLEDRLLDAARDLFAEEGFAGATMEKIAKRAGASTKALYSRFAGKEEMLAAVVRREARRAVAGQAEALPFHLLDTDLRAFLVALCTHVAKTIAADPAGLNRLALAEGGHFPELKRLYETSVARGGGVIQAALEQWRDRLPDLVEPQRAAELCFSMTTDFARLRLSFGAPPKAAEIEARVAYAVDLFLRGCGYVAKAPAGRGRRTTGSA
jgi:AcrR family transcriptional regulator